MVFGMLLPLQRFEIGANTDWSRDFGKYTLALSPTSFLSRFLQTRLVKRGTESCERLVKAIDPIFASGLDKTDIARFECANALGSFANTVPTSFWNIFHVYSDAKLLVYLRSQISAITSTTATDDGNTIRLINLEKLRTQTTVFSAVQEVYYH
jgi:hypothetical protein